MNIYSPLEQFEIFVLLPIQAFDGLNFSITNFSFSLSLIFLLILIWFKLSLYKATVIPNIWQALKELLYKLTVDLIKNSLGKKGEKYFPSIFLLHVFLLTCNLTGMIPYSFTLTSHIIFTFGLACSIFISINLIGFLNHGFHFFNIFLPRNIPLPIVPLIVTIEIISYILKVFTLSIRLFANMTSGHTLLKIIAGFSWTMLLKGGWLSFFHWVPLIVLFILIILELGIALLQAYVFTLLTCIYLNDAFEEH